MGKARFTKQTRVSLVYMEDEDDEQLTSPLALC